MDERPPYGAYAAIMGVFVGGLAAAGAASRALGRDPQCQTALDLAVLSAASFKAARTLARDEVTSFLREPFVEGAYRALPTTHSLGALARGVVGRLPSYVHAYCHDYDLLDRTRRSAFVAALAILGRRRRMTDLDALAQQNDEPRHDRRGDDEEAGPHCRGAEPGE